MKKSQIIIAFIIVFFSGMLIGVLGGKYYYNIFRGDPPPPPPRDFRVMLNKKVVERLKLSDEQQKKILPAFEKWHESFMAMNKANAPIVKNIFFTLFDDIEKSLALSPEQKEELAKMREAALERITMHGKFRVGNGPPPFRPEGKHQEESRKHGNSQPPEDI